MCIAEAETKYLWVLNPFWAAPCRNGKHGGCLMLCPVPVEPFLLPAPKWESRPRTSLFQPLGRAGHRAQRGAYAKTLQSLPFRLFLSKCLSSYFKGLRQSVPLEQSSFLELACGLRHLNYSSCYKMYLLYSFKRTGCNMAISRWTASGFSEVSNAVIFHSPPITLITGQAWQSVSMWPA